VPCLRLPTLRLDQPRRFFDQPTRSSATSSPRLPIRGAFWIMQCSHPPAYTAIVITTPLGLPGVRNQQSCLKELTQSTAVLHDPHIHGIDITTTSYLSSSVRSGPSERLLNDCTRFFLIAETKLPRATTSCYVDVVGVAPGSNNASPSFPTSPVTSCAFGQPPSLLPL
jgi:hypothetical protein